MALTASGLAALVYKDLVAAFPTAVQSTRQNSVTGVPFHIVPQAFISAYCEAVVTSLLSLTIMDIGAGTADVTGMSVPVTVTFPGINTARALLIAEQGWTGPQSAPASMIFIDSVLLNVAAIGMVRMNPNPTLGTGTGVISTVANISLEATALAALQTNLVASFEAAGQFSEGDVPGNPVNTTLLAQFPGYAKALANGIASVLGQVVYTGTGAVPTTIGGIPNVGVFV